MKESKFTNLLIHEKSPYLLQHAHNPVYWYPWGTEALTKASHDNKLVLISIGYAACHWCHVMEKESFENEEIATIMNDYFICIKVDREERPDIDQIYMEAVQMINGNGGWPLNCFALPDGRPVFGGTYFRPQQWKQILLGLSASYQTDKFKFLQVAENLTTNMKLAENLTSESEKNSFLLNDLHEITDPWKNRFDTINGGNKEAPKFPMPNSLQFLLEYYYHTKDETIKNHLVLTLRKMAYGGIFDQIGGGFARYSVDQVWLVPHFEKMLYDNAQLVGLYAKAWQLFQLPEFKQTVFDTLSFIEREMTSAQGGFYSSLDADSEGEEGKFYTWTKDEIDRILIADSPIYCDFYNITDDGNWEDHKNILFRNNRENQIAEDYGITNSALLDKIEHCNAKLLKERENKIRPGLDDKILTSWNALMLSGYIAAFRIFNETRFLEIAKRNAEFIHTKMMDDNFALKRNFKDNERGEISGFLDDYAFVIEAFIQLYQANFDQKWIEIARNLAEYTLLHFFDEETGLFYYTSDTDEKLILRKKEIHDNVIPSSNSAMAKNLFQLGKYFYNEKYSEIATRMLGIVKEDIKRSGIYYSNWATLLLWHVFEPYEVVIAGPNVIAYREVIDKHYFPTILLAGSALPSALPIMENRYRENETQIYICRDRICHKPLTIIEEAVQFIEKKKH